MQSAHQPILAPHRIVDEELARVVFSPGDPMTEAEAKKYGVPIPDEAAKPEADEVTKRARKNSANRAKTLKADRSRKSSSES